MHSSTKSIGRHIWHDQDCYFVDRLETAYYAPDARWTPAGDPCTECRCLENQTYTCAPKRCARTFLCPPGQRPRSRRGECCPSYCGSPSASSKYTNHPNEKRYWAIYSPNCFNTMWVVIKKLTMNKCIFVLPGWWIRMPLSLFCLYTAETKQNMVNLHILPQRKRVIFQGLPVSS